MLAALDEKEFAGAREAGEKRTLDAAWLAGLIRGDMDSP